MTIDGLERLGRLVYWDQFRTRHILEGPEDPLLHKVADMIEDLLAEQSELRGYWRESPRL